MSNSAKCWAVSSCLLFAAMLCVASSASAANIPIVDITGTLARNFTEEVLWDPLPTRPNVVPGSGDLPIINFGDGITDYVYVDTNIEIQRFNVAQLAGTSGGLEVRSGATLTTNLASGSETNVGQGGIGHLRIKSGATLTNAGLLYAGRDAGNGTITLENGGTHNVGRFLVVGRIGTATYSMQGGSLTIGEYLQMATGATGNGTFKQSAGALQINRNGAAGQQGLHIASVAGGVGLYEISGDSSLTIADTNPGIINGTAGTGGGSFGTFRIVGSEPTITVGKDYTQRKDSKLDLVFDAGGISPLNLGGKAFLDGILSASFTTVPTVGQEFQIIKYVETLTGTFATFDTLVDSPLGPDTVQLSINYGSGMNDVIKLTVDSLHTAIAGDFDADGDVDGADFIAWQTNFPKATGATLTEGDADDDDDVDGADFAMWQSAFPNSPGFGVSPVPEPASMLLLAVGGLFLAASKRTLPT